MFINTINDRKIKILIDEVDLNNAGIAPENWISNSNQTLSYIENLLKSKTNFNWLPPKLVLEDYFIFTYHYKVFSITLLLSEKG